MDIWYAISCTSSQQKARIRSLLKDKHHVDHKMPNLRLVMLTYDKLKKYDGFWHTEKIEMFPEYLIVDGSTAWNSETADENVPERIADAVHYDNIAYHNPVWGGRPVPIPEVLELEDGEEALLKAFCCVNSNMPLSKGVIQDGTVIVKEGPLVGHESRIRKIDRHKRLATIQIPFLGVETRVMTGLEIMEKTV